MRIVLFGATGNVGRRIAKEAVKRGHQVVGVVRDPATVDAPDPGVELVRGDATNPERIAEIALGADAVVSAISPRPTAGNPAAPKLADNARAIIAGLRKAGVTRVLYVGGASSLEVAPGKRLFDQPNFPEAYKAEAKEGIDALDIWRSEGEGLDWTYLSPAAEIGPGERTGRYRSSRDRLLADERGRSFISYEDFGAAVLDELERPKNVGGRFGVAY